jgi:hypothetical protein
MLVMDMAGRDVGDGVVLASYVRHHAEVSEAWNGAPLNKIIPVYDEYIEFRYYENLEWDRQFQRWQVVLNQTCARCWGAKPPKCPCMIRSQTCRGC